MRYLTHALPFCALLALPLSNAALAEAVGNVEKVVGEVHGTPPNGVPRQLAGTESVVQDEFVQTQVGGGVSIIFLDGSEFRLGSNSSAMLDRFLYDPAAANSEGVVQLGQGVFRFISDQGSSHEGLQVQTPNSVIGIRGTDFVVLSDRQAGTTVGTGSGLVELTSLRTGETIAIQPGQLGAIDLDGGLSLDTAPVPADELACWLANDSYVCLAAAGGSGAGSSSAEPNQGQDPSPSDPGPSDPGPSDPGPSDPGDDAGNDPNDPGPSDPGSDPGEGDPSGGGDPGDGDPGGN